MYFFRLYKLMKYFCNLAAVSHHQSESESESNNEDYIPDDDDDWKKVRLAVG